MKYITFWTPDFHNPVRRLISTAKTHGVDLYDKPIKKDRAWRAIVKTKPRFIFNCMKKFKDHDDIVWIDADSMFVKNPGSFVYGRADLMYRPWKRKNITEPIASVLYFKNSPKMRGFVEQWAKDTEALSPKTQRPEQRTLGKLMCKTHGIRKREFIPTTVMQKWIGPHKDGCDKTVASIWTTRWFGHDVSRSENHAYVEKQHREDGIWTKEAWEYGV